MIKENINVVEKVWGFEHWLVNREYCGKMLIVDEGATCSYHRHLKKTETFYCPSGRVKLTIDDEEYDLNPFARPKTIIAGEFHKFHALEPSLILEISTHHEDDDVERVTESIAGIKNDSNEDTIPY